MRNAFFGVLQTLGIVAVFPAAGLALATLYPPGVEAGAPRFRQWLVDGFNVIQVGLLAGSGRPERDGWWRAERRRELLARAGRLDDAEAEVVVVFDGPEPASDAGLGRARAVFAPSADDWLLAQVRDAPDPARLCLVTADRRLAARARQRGAEVVTPGAFLARCPEPVDDGAWRADSSPGAPNDGDA